MCLMPAGVFAQDQDIRVEYFGEEKGLSITWLTDILCDRSGFLWLATREGLVRFDGYSFRHFRHVPGDTNSIFSNNLHCVKEDAEGNIWCGLVRGGVSRYDRRTGKFRNYHFTDRLKSKTATVYSIFFDRDGEVWLGVSGNGIIHLDKQTGDFRQYDVVTTASAPHLNPVEVPLHNTAFNFWQDENGQFWLASGDDLCLFDPKTGQAGPRRSIQPRAGEFTPNEAFSLQADGDLLWVGGWGSGLRRLNRRTGEWKQYFFLKNHPYPSAVNVVNKTLTKDDDELWVSSADRGMGIFNKTTGSFFFFAHDSDRYPQLPKQLGLLVQDQQGNFWTNSENRLVRIQLRNNQFRRHEIVPSRPELKIYNQPTLLFEDREGRFRFLGLYGGDGLHVLDKRTGKTIIPAIKKMPGADGGDESILDIQQARDGTIWVTNRHFVFRFNPETMQLEAPQPQPPVFSKEHKTNWYNHFTEDENGDLWLSSALFGVFRYNPHTGASRHFMPVEGDPNSIPTNIVSSMTTDRRGRVWFGSRDKTAYGYFLPAENRCVRLDPQGMPTTEATSMQVSRFFTDPAGGLWVCSEQGLLHFDCNGSEPRLLKKYTAADGLPTDYIWWGVAVSADEVWCASVIGICRLDVKTGQIATFTRYDGLPMPLSSMGSLPDGQLYLMEAFSFYTFDPAALQPVRSHAPLALTSFRVDNIERYAGSDPLPPEPLVIPADSRHFSLEFAALDLSGPERCEYEYLFEGFDNQWVKTGRRRFFSFTNVAPGRYFFKVKLAGAPDSEAIAVPLLVEVAFYKTLWFWSLIAAAAAAVAWRIYEKRRAQARQLQELKSKTQLLEKEKAVVMYEGLKQQLNPHFLFNSLTSLSSLIQIDPRSAATFLENLSKTYRYILKSSERETVPLGEELKFAESFVQLQKTRFDSGLEVRFAVPEEFFHRKIVPVTLQNLIENAIKHNIIDEETPLVVDVFVENDCLVVRNNLQKKSFVETSNRKGLVSLRSFYRYLSDRNIETTDDGQFFTIKIPLL